MNSRALPPGKVVGRRLSTMGLLLLTLVSAQAASFTWQPVAAGTFTWQSPDSNWTSGQSSSHPDAVGDVANLTSNLTGAQVITLNNQAVTIGVLNIGDSTPSHSFSLTSGTLVFQAGPGQAAQLNAIYGAGGPRLSYNVNTDVFLSSDLAINGVTSGTDVINMGGNINTNGHVLTLNASSTVGRSANAIPLTSTIQINTLSGNGTLVSSGPGFVSFSGSSGNYTGAVEIRGGRFGLEGTDTYLDSTQYTVYGNAVTGLNNGGTVLEVGKATRTTPTNPSGRMNDNAVVTLRGGGFALIGGVTADVTTIETIKEIVLEEGNSNINVSRGDKTTSYAELHLTSLTRKAGATGQVRGGSDFGLNNRIMIANAPTLIGGGGAVGTATVGIIPWLAGNASGAGGDDVTQLVTYDPTYGLRPLAAAEYVANFTSGTATVNVNAGNTSVTVTSTINALRYNSGSPNNSLNITGPELKITSGALLFASSGSIRGTGILNFDTAEGIIYTVKTNTNAIAVAIAGSGGLTKAGTGTLFLEGANTFTGTVTVAGGVLQAGANNVLGANNAVVLANTTVNTANDTYTAVTTALDLNGFNQSIRSLSGGGAYGGAVRLGSGTMTIAGNNVAATYSGSIGGTGAVVKNGSGTQTFAGGSGYTGGTTLNLGTLLVNNTAGSATGGGAVAVKATDASAYATLGGGAGAANGGTLVTLGAASSSVYEGNTVGIITGPVTVEQYAHLSPGNSVGTLTVGALTLNGGSVLDWEFNLTSNDFVDVRVLGDSTGLLTFVGTTGINLYLEGTHTTFAPNGLYNLFHYDEVAGFNASALSVLNPVGGYTYSFINDTENNLIQLSVNVIPEPQAAVLLLGGLGLVVMFRRVSRVRA